MIFPILDLVFSLVHITLIFFNLLGWIHPKTRRLHLYSISITLFSWVGIGYFFGWGYCFLTDWHYQILDKLGEQNLPHSYITYLIQKVSGWKLDDNLVMEYTGVVFAFVVIIAWSQWAYLKLKKRSE